MAPRPYWKGYLKLSLVACPVAVFTATTSSERIVMAEGPLCCQLTGGSARNLHQIPALAKNVPG